MRTKTKCNEITYTKTAANENIYIKKYNEENTQKLLYIINLWKQREANGCVYTYEWCMCHCHAHYLFYTQHTNSIFT